MGRTKSKPLSNLCWVLIWINPSYLSYLEGKGQALGVKSNLVFNASDGQRWPWNDEF